MKAIKKIITDEHSIRLVVLGDGPEKLISEKYVKDNNLSEFVEFKGEKFGKERISFYQNADIFCAPYSDEAFGITILEALACGVPVVGFKKYAPYPVVLVELENNEKVYGQLVDQEQKDLKIGTKVISVLRKVRTASVDGVIAYGIKFKPLK